MSDSIRQAGASVYFPIVVDGRDGRVEGEIELPAGPVRLAELAEGIVGISSVFSDLVEESAQSVGAPVSCCKGCGACCRQLVPISLAEALMLAEIVAGLPEPRRKVIEERFEAIEQRLRETGLLDPLNNLDSPELSDNKIHYEMARKYFNLQLPCPFLEDESCSIHLERPSVCREYLVNSPAARCSDPFENPVSRLTVSVRMSEALAGVGSQVLKTDTLLIPLSLALPWVRDHPKARTRTWDSRELIARFQLHMDVMLGQLAKERAEHEREFTPENLQTPTEEKS